MTRDVTLDLKLERQGVLTRKLLDCKLRNTRPPRELLFRKKAPILDKFESLRFLNLYFFS